MSEARVSASIIIPTYNRPDMLIHAVTSALSALPQAGEVLVSDDGSIRAAETLSEFSHPNLRVTVNPGKKGAAANRNHAVAEARGDLIFFLDDDDMMFPGYPAHVLAARRRNTADWGFSATEEHTARTTTLAKRSGEPEFTVLSSGPFRERIAGLGYGFWISRDLYQKTGGIREELQVNEDTDFCIALLADGHAPLWTSTPGVSLYRGAADSLTSSTSAQVRAACFKAILERHAKYLSENPDGLRFILRRYLRFAARSGTLSEGVLAALTKGPYLSRPGNVGTFLASAAFQRRT